MKDHVLFTGATSNAFEQSANPRGVADEVTSARSYYTMNRPYPMPCAARKRVLPESLSSETHRTVETLTAGFSRPHRLLAEKPLADTAEPQRMLVPVDATGTPQMLLMPSPKGTPRLSATFAHLSRTSTASETALMFESSVVKTNPALHPPAQNVHELPRTEITTPPFCVNRVFADRLLQYGQTLPPAHRLQNHHVSQTRTSLKPKDADASATLWSEAASQADVLAFFGSQDDVKNLAASSSLRASHKAPVSKELSWTAVDAATNSFCDISFSDCIFSAATTVTGVPQVSGTLRGHVIDPQAVLGFHRDGARRQRRISKAVRNAEPQ
ncbi:hypothetical protein LDHU3_22.2020:CDS1 [Leishmania donovani]|uniref:Hypothetical_protein n=1 Tax=Leishmania donovani TaxID=5661 RepID=A0A504Y1P3_LEIDO|nr:hypothetical protein CGC21_1995 [Leishmania donovani]TPP54005.1 hypothetical protein CGC20_16085 [Leishmania donovani]CAJ1988858.1 hypothetical protein LDHU3_22.2020:CDS1 [Leishmania donovani]VDZ44736.1 hypothetical_protein [Leishmania donovani]